MGGEGWGMGLGGRSWGRLLGWGGGGRSGGGAEDLGCAISAKQSTTGTHEFMLSDFMLSERVYSFNQN